MLDHITVPVSDYARAKRMWSAAFAPLGWVSMMELTQKEIPVLAVEITCAVGPAKGPLGHPWPLVWLRPDSRPIAPMHVAARADDRALVDTFHRVALEAGFVDHGAPGVRAHYHPGYYGAFVLDPDGHNLEVVCHR